MNPVEVQTVQVEAPKTRAIDKYKGKFILKPCQSTWLELIDPKHDGASLFSEAKIFLSPEIDKDTGLVKTGLTDQEARELEEEMGLAPKTLVPYNKAYWGNFKLYPQVSKKGFLLDLDNSALAKLQYCFAKANSRVAIGHAGAQLNQQADIVLVNTEQETKVKSEEINVKKKAFSVLSKMTLSEQVDFLKVFKEGKFRVSKSSTEDFINTTIGKIVDETPQDFLDTVSNPYIKTFIFLADCVQNGFVKKVGPKYQVVGGDQLGESTLNAVENLNSPEYNELKLSLAAKLASVK